MAGINAHQKTKELEPLILKRGEAYIGVLIDDLISKGTDEPYRMFTSRAEFRTMLRQDNADLRLTEISHKLGLASEERFNAVKSKISHVAEVKTVLQDFAIDKGEAAEYLESKNSATLTQKQRAAALLLRPNIDLQGLQDALPALKESLSAYDELELEQAEIQIKYGIYIEKEIELMARMNQLENLNIPENFNYDKIRAISAEALQKFKKIRPQTIGQASRISGVNPSDVQILMVYMGR